MTEWISQSFFFDWNKVTDPTPVPITAQCETIQITWSRATATGPDPVAPYYLEIFTSHYIFPFQIPAGSQLSTNLTVPFAPGTQYQICMWDSVGNSGGCQAVYTVDAPPAAQSETGQCNNFTMPATVLQVNSSAGQYAWIPSCTDLVLKPTTGQAPYQVTIAPALHPPYNISNIGSEGTSWKVQLMWGMPFFVSMTDSSGLAWSYGPLHAGQGSTDCLGSLASGGVATGIVAGSFAASFILGALIAFCVLTVLNRRRKERGYDTDGGHVTPIKPRRQVTIDAMPYVNPYEDRDTSQPLMHNSGEYFGTPDGRADFGRTATTTQNSYTAPQLSPSYHIEAFDPRSPNNDGATSPTLTHAPSESAVSRGQASTSRTTSQQVYVVHHDQGPAPVSIYTAEGTEVVELPPLYSGGPRTASPRERLAPNQIRPPGAAPPEVIQTLPGTGRTVSNDSRGTDKGSSGPRPMPGR